MTTKTYKAKGLIYGNYWGGGSGAYPTITILADTKKELLIKANKALKDGSLDKGMGYESLVGAILDITTITTKVISGKTFTNKEIETETIGTLTDEQIEFLEENLIYH